MLLLCLHSSISLFLQRILFGHLFYRALFLRGHFARIFKHFFQIFRTINSRNVHADILVCLSATRHHPLVVLEPR